MKMVNLAGLHAITTKKEIIMKYKFEIIQEEGDDYTEEFSDLKKLMLEVFEEWKGMGWVHEALLQADKGKFLIRFFIDINSYYENKQIIEIRNIEDLNQTINIIFNSFGSGYQKTYKIEELPT